MPELNAQYRSTQSAVSYTHLDVYKRQAEYRSSGVMTFIVNQDGVVYEKDLGKKTDVVAKNMKEYNPNSSWQKADEQQEEIASEQHAK